MAQALALAPRILLNAGCGPHQPLDWLNLDVNPEHEPDVIASLEQIPLDDGSCERVFACHVLEHADYFRSVPLILDEFMRVLAPGGQLCVIGPDIERAVLLGEPSRVLQGIVAWPPEFNPARYALRLPPAGHAWTPSAIFMQDVLGRAGFAWENRTEKMESLRDDGWPLGVNLVAWEHAYLCTR